MIKKFISGNEYYKLAEQLCSIIPPNKYKMVCGIPRGGLPLAVYLSHNLNLKLKENDVDHVLDVSYYTEAECKKILIVDDLIDTGKTVLENELYRFFDIACLYKKPWSKYQPTYFVEETDLWIVFPYENPSEIPNR